ncbi:MAG: hypothetical protein ACFHVJ_16700 [Aestuariibacter sp.]
MRPFNLKSAICAASLFLTANALAGNHNYSDASDYSGFKFKKKEALTVSRTSSLELSMSPEQALPLFTAPGEILWEPGWDPTILSGNGFDQGTTWLTQNGTSMTYWHVSKYDKDNNEAIYTLVTPDVKMGTVSIAISANEKGGSEVLVTYNLTSLGNAGDLLLLSQYSEEQFPKFIAQWKDWIASSMDKINSNH